MNGFIHQNQSVIAVVGTSASVVGTAAGFFAAITPILQIISLIIGITAGLLTIVHFLRMKL